MMRSTCGLLVFAALLVVGLCQAKEIGSSAFKVVNAKEDVNVDTVNVLRTTPSLLEGEWYTVALSGAAREPDRAKDLLPSELIELIAKCPCLVTNITRVPIGRLKTQNRADVAASSGEERFHIVYFCQGKPQLTFRGLLNSVPNRPGLYELKVEHKKSSSFEEGPEPTKEEEKEKEGKKVEKEGEKVEPGKEKEEKEEEEKAENGKESEKEIQHKEGAKKNEIEIEEEKVKKGIKKGISNFYILDFEEGEKGEGGATPRGLMLASLSSKDFVCIKSRSLPVTKTQLEPLMRYAKKHGFADLEVTGCRATNMPKPARD